MKRLRRFLVLPRKDRRLIVRAVLWLALSGVGLRLVPFEKLRRAVTWFARNSRRGHRMHPRMAGRIISAVELASRQLPVFDSCLTKALAAQMMLGRAGFSSRIQIGVARDEDGKFTAHAWVESHGDVLIGGSHVDRYVPLFAWGGERS